MIIALIVCSVIILVLIALGVYACFILGSRYDDALDRANIEYLKSKEIEKDDSKVGYHNSNVDSIEHTKGENNYESVCSDSFN